LPYFREVLMAHNNGLMIGAIIEKDEKKYRVIDCNEEYIILSVQRKT